MNNENTSPAHDEGQYSQFILGFMIATQCDNTAKSEEQWAGFSVQMSDGERIAIENRGKEAGLEMGHEFNTLYPELHADGNGMPEE